MSKRKTKPAPVAAVAPAPDVAAAGRVLVLRTCNPDLTSRGGFQWPASGPVEAPDWNGRDNCGGGLHGFLWGEGDGRLASWEPDAKWLVVSVDPVELLHGTGDLIGKCKFRRGVVVYSGDRKGATEYIAANGAAGRAIVGGTATAGDSGTATAGDSGTATAGDSGTATAGVGGTATAGVGGTATAGYSGTATAGVGGTATAGVGGTATAGYSGTATAGVGGTATAGDSGTATAGYSGTIVVRWWDVPANRYRLTVGYPGEGGIVAGKAYKCDEAGRLVDATTGEVAL